MHRGTTGTGSGGARDQLGRLPAGSRVWVSAPRRAADKPQRTLAEIVEFLAHSIASPADIPNRGPALTSQSLVSGAQGSEVGSFADEALGFLSRHAGTAQQIDGRRANLDHDRAGGNVPVCSSTRLACPAARRAGSRTETSPWGSSRDSSRRRTAPDRSRMAPGIGGGTFSPSVRARTTARLSVLTLVINMSIWVLSPDVAGEVHARGARERRHLQSLAARGDSLPKRVALHGPRAGKRSLTHVQVGAIERLGDVHQGRRERPLGGRRDGGTAVVGDLRDRSVAAPRAGQRQLHE